MSYHLLFSQVPSQMWLCWRIDVFLICSDNNGCLVSSQVLSLPCFLMLCSDILEKKKLMQILKWGNHWPQLTFVGWLASSAIISMFPSVFVLFCQLHVISFTQVLFIAGCSGGLKNQTGYLYFRMTFISDLIMSLFML